MSLLQIDVSMYGYEPEEDLIIIRFPNEEYIQINFAIFFIKSKYIRDKYKYCEAFDSIQSEIDEIWDKLHISSESLKYFFKLIEDDKVNIPIELYKDIFALSEHFHTQKVTFVLDKIMQEELTTNLDFTIQILIDLETSKKRLETKLMNKIENFLKEQINECIVSAKFGELPVSTIYRIIDQSKEKVDHDLLVDFILESIESRFIMFKFIKPNKLREDKVDEMIEFIDEQEENSRKKYLEYIPFDLSLIKNEKCKQSKQKLDEYKREMNKTKHYTKSILVCGLDDYDQLGVKTNKEVNDTWSIYPPMNLSIDPASILSFSVYIYHSVIVMNDGSLKGIGENSEGQINPELQRSIIDKFTDFCIKDSNNHRLDAVSAVCYTYGTLYMVSKSGSHNNERQLVLCDCSINNGNPVFLDIGKHQPVSLFGGIDLLAAIGSEGEVIFIDHFWIKKSPNSPIEVVSLPDGEKASSVACLKLSVVVLSSSGRVFNSPVGLNGVLNFSIVSELADHEIICVSGTYEHCLAVSKEGRVFACGSNEYGEIGLGERIKSVSSFTEISSLRRYKIKAAYAGYCFSLFQTKNGKILACGRNYCGELLFSKEPNKIDSIYLPIETTIKEGACFCIVGCCLSVVFIGEEPPPNTPNMRVLQYQ